VIAVVARFVAALANGTFWAIGAVVATDAAGRGSSARAISVMVSGFTLANVLGAPIGTAIGQVLGWRGPFVLLTVFAVGAAVLVAKQVAADPPGDVDIRSAVRSETAVLKRPALWLLYLATALIPGGLLATFSYIAPLLLDRAQVPSAIVPVALLGYGVGAVVGVLLGGRFGDHRPLLMLVSAVAVQILVLVAMTVWGADGAVVVPLLVVLGGAGVLVNPVLTALVVRIAGSANTIAVALSTSAFNVGIAVGSALGGAALGGALGLVGPPVVGCVLTALALLPLGVLAATGRGRARASAAGASLTASTSRSERAG
jgi:DHA1 family inner membrane transport protein